MHPGRRPVYGGAPRHPPKIAANVTTRGVQGSCGPLVGGRRIETVGPLVLSVTKEQRCIEKMSKKKLQRCRQGQGGCGGAGVKAMEMHQGRRPVYGGAPRHPPKIASNAISRGVQGSRGPLVGGRRIETAGPLVLSVMKEQR